ALPPVTPEQARILELKARTTFGGPEPRWDIGTDRNHVAAYVGMALIAGFALGFVAAKYIFAERVPKKPADRQENALLHGASGQPDGTGALATNGFHKVTDVILADTLQVEGVGPVRMLGIDTPDRKTPEESYGAQGKIAVEYVKQALLGKEVRLEFDPGIAPPGREDASGGDLLAYVYTRDGALFNAEMVKQGMAFARVTVPFKMLDDFRGFEREAMESMRGVWGPVGGEMASSSPESARTTPGRTPDPKSKKLSPLLPSELDPKSPSLPGTITPGTISPGEVTVYVSSADHMYHKSGCEYLDKKRQAMSLSEAKAAGYVACGRCFASTVMKAP
ncbi:MAG TPA: thermonuclease family protein, partial [Blastocatellia bacterium]|nr:thermonuclease family protein [Blastocatellia bacterium]